MADSRPNVQQSQLSKEGVSLDAKTVTVSGGLETYVNDIFRAQDKAKILRNVHQFKKGVFSSGGGGWTRDNSVPLAGSPVGLGFGIFQAGNGTQSLLAQYGAGLYKYDTVAHTFTAFAAPMNALSTTAVPTMVQYSPSTSSTSPITIYTNGDIEPRKAITATTSAALLFNSPGVWPGVFLTRTYSKPKYSAAFGDRAAYTGFANTGASGDLIVQDVLISNLQDPEKFTQAVPILATDACIFTVPAVLGRPTALHSFKINNNNSTEVLLIGCERGVCLITGTNTTTYNLQILTYGHGVLSNHCFVQLDNVLFYLATDGIRVYTGEQNNSNVLVDSLTLGIFDRIQQIDQAQAFKAHAIHHPATQEVWFWVPFLGDAGVIKHAFVMNYNTVDGDPIWMEVDTTVCTASIEFLQTFYGGGDSSADHTNIGGIVQRWYGVDNYDQGSFVDTGGKPTQVVPPSQITFSLIGVGNPAQQCSIRQAMVITDGGDQSMVINAATYQEMGDGHFEVGQMAPIDFTLESISAGQTALDSWVLDTSAFPSQHPKFLEYTPVGQGRLWEFTIQKTLATHNFDIAAFHCTISIGGMRF